MLGSAEQQPIFVKLEELNREIGLQKALGSYLLGRVAETYEASDRVGCGQAIDVYQETVHASSSLVEQHPRIIAAIRFRNLCENVLLSHQKGAKNIPQGRVGDAEIDLSREQNGLEVHLRQSANYWGGLGVVVSSNKKNERVEYHGFGAQNDRGCDALVKTVYRKGRKWKPEPSLPIAGQSEIDTLRRLVLGNELSEIERALANKVIFGG